MQIAMILAGDKDMFTAKSDSAVAAVHDWNARKRRVLKCEQIVRASERLQAKCWLPETT